MGKRPVVRKKEMISCFNINLIGTRRKISNHISMTPYGQASGVKTYICLCLSCGNYLNLLIIPIHQTEGLGQD